MSKMFKASQSEKEFLLTLVTDQINRQYGKKVKPSDYDIVSIRPVVGYKLGYEVTTKRPDDEVRYRVYFNVTDKDVLGRFSLRVEQGYVSVESLEDEVLVAFGTIDIWYVTNKVYSFLPIDNPNLKTEFLTIENGERLLLENGEAFLLE